MNISTIMNPVTKICAKGMFKIKVASPKIFLGLGVAGVVAAVVVACKETPKAVEIIEEHREVKEKIDRVRKNPDAFSEEYTDFDFRKDVCTAYAKTAGKLIRTYAPATTILTLSIASILYSHGIMSARNAELLAACKALQESFATYRKRVRERFGDDKDWEASFVDEFTGNNTEIVGDDGKKKTEYEVVVSNQASPYARFFDENNVNWVKDRAMNLYFLQAQQKFANDKLNAHGFLFLNDVYEALGIPKTSYGQVVGWYLGGFGDNFVDFGIFDGNNEKKRDFVNGLEPAILLDFNVDGVVYDMI